MALSDMLGPSLQIGSTVLSAGSQFARANTYGTVGRRRKAALDFEAAQEEEQAGQVQAGAQRTAEDIGRQATLVNSAAIARAAASGAGASDPTVMNIVARTSQEGAYRQAQALYEGEAKARLDRLRAQAARYEGDTVMADAEAARRASMLGASSTVLTGGVKSLSMFDKYWAGPSVESE